MQTRLTPMIRAPEVSATIDWYRSLGFAVVDSHEDDGEVDWAMLALGEGAVMFNAGGAPSTGGRREVDLFVTTTEDIDALFERVRERAEVVSAPYDAFYGMREFILRDLNGFWITFARALS